MRSWPVEELQGYGTEKEELGGLVKKRIRKGPEGEEDQNHKGKEGKITVVLYFGVDKRSV